MSREEFESLPPEQAMEYLRSERDMPDAKPRAPVVLGVDYAAGRERIIVEQEQVKYTRTNYVDV
jgi:hypothetical protein